jgi:hypothetical protein
MGLEPPSPAGEKIFPSVTDPTPLDRPLNYSPEHGWMDRPSGESSASNAPPYQSEIPREEAGRWYRLCGPPIR